MYPLTAEPSPFIIPSCPCLESLPHSAAATMSSPCSDFFDLNAYLTTDICAPHPDDFELELDSRLADIHDTDLPQVVHTNNEPWQLTMPQYGPGSVFTESTYDSLSSHGGSIFNFPTSPSISLLDMELQKFSLDAVSEYATSSTLADTVDPTSFGALPPTPPHSPPVPAAKFTTRSFSDYGISAPNFFDSYNDTTVSPSRVTGHIPITNGIPQSLTTDDVKVDTRRKYQCSTCPRCNFISSVHFPSSDHLFVLFPSSSLCPCVQSQDPHGNPRPQQVETSCVPPSVLRKVLQPQA